MEILRCVFLLLTTAIHLHECIIVRIKDGKIRGTISTTRNFRNFYAFKGIPFAKPPVGELRFRDPQPVKPWGNNILNTTEDAPKCIQKNYFAGIDPPVEGKEDCLYLNVYTPKLCQRCLKKLPVMFYMFFGGFLAGSGKSDHAGPEYLLDRDIVLVSINYRLSVFGFLSTGDDNASGNWGFKDQTFALKWVQENIEVFGGDKNRVTIFGESAGSGSAHLHMFSPISRGLFHRAISQSGTAMSFWAKPANDFQIQNARKQAGFVGCNPNDSLKNIVSCLRKVPADVLAESLRYFKQILVEPTVTFCIVTEKRTQLNPNPFLEDDPYNLIQNGQFYDVPWICGNTENEGLVRTAYILRNETYKSTFVQNLDVNLPIMMGLGASVSSSDIPKVNQKIVDFYLEGDTQMSSLKGIDGFVNIFGDRFMVYGTYQSALLQAMKVKSPIWVYRYNYRSELTYTDYFSFTSNPVKGTIGVSHTDDIIPLFYLPAIFNRSLSSIPDLIMSYTMVDMWTSFATTGNPSPNNMFYQLEWKSLSNLYGRSKTNISDLRYLYIEGPNLNSKNPIKFEMRNDFFVDRIKFWNDLGLPDTPPEIV